MTYMTSDIIQHTSLTCYMLTYDKLHPTPRNNYLLDEADDDDDDDVDGVGVNSREPSRDSDEIDDVDVEEDEKEEVPKVR